MTIIQYNGKQFTVSIAPEHMERMGWIKGTEVYITKHPDMNFLYIEKMSQVQTEKKEVVEK